MINNFSKTTRTQQEVLNIIAKKKLEPGDKIPTEVELSKILGVSVVTIRRGLEELVRQKIIERMQGRGTFLKSNIMGHPKAGTIAFLLVDRPTALYEKLIAEHRTAVKTRSYDLKLIVSGEKPDEIVTGELAGVNGTVITGNVTEEWLEFLEAMRIPFVLLGSYELTKAAFNVKYNYSVATENLVTKLYDRGCRKIGLINGRKRHIPCREIFEGYRKKMKNLGLKFIDRDIIWCSIESRYQDIESFFCSSSKNYDGLIVESGCLNHIHMFFYEHPEQQPHPILGLFDNQVSSLHNLSKYVFVQFNRLQGETSIDLLFQAMSGLKLNKRTVKISPKE